jgi:hypothetical protein
MLDFYLENKIYSFLLKIENMDTLRNVFISVNIRRNIIASQKLKYFMNKKLTSDRDETFKRISETLFFLRM